MPDILHVAIVEDDDEIRQTLSLIIRGTPGFHCAHVFVDAESALKELPNLYVNVVLMDIELPGMTGIEAIRRLAPQLTGVDFIMLTIRDDDDAVFNSLVAGASGYLLKDTPPSELLRHIKEVSTGGSPMSARIARRVVNSFKQTASPSPLSARETEILQLLCDGRNYRDIAETLFLSPHTIKTHIKNIYHKLQVHSRGEAVSKAIKEGLVD
ncbi:MAG: response regulator transcription factor [Bacteroidota bacterium]